MVAECPATRLRILHPLRHDRAGGARKASASVKLARAPDRGAVARTSRAVADDARARRLSRQLQRRHRRTEEATYRL